MGTGRGLHFAYHADLTLSAQRLADALAAEGAAGRAACRRADRSYFWNRTLAKPVMGARLLMPDDAMQYALVLLLGREEAIPA